ncbi:hypothetical protein ACH5RR_016779 [Cinchona calisaya]|uniref:C2 domain-containing protein n=1 Tax=Cinchona calisaya TaxID=153742 RepID=A0ABD3A028_9GENT
MRRRNSYSGGEDYVHKPYYILHVRIKKATKVDEVTGVFAPIRRKTGYYGAVITDSQHMREFSTQVVRGVPEPKWEHDISIIFDEFPQGESLFVEILQFGSEGDPQTSSGIVVVGRARIPVPTQWKKFGVQHHEFFRMMGSEKKVEGIIVMRMELEMRTLKRSLMHIELRDRSLKRSFTSC